MARILVIDDSVFVREAMESCLSGLGHSVKSAPDGETGLRLAETEWADIVLLDVDLPRMTGITVCRDLKRDPRRSQLPVVMMTGRPTPEIRLQAYAAGAAVLLSKPFSLEQLQDELNRHLPAGV